MSQDGANALRESLELAREDPRDAELAQRNAELAQLRAENEDLTAKSYSNVILNVELTTLRNQVSHWLAGDSRTGSKSDRAEQSAVWGSVC